MDRNIADLLNRYARISQVVADYSDNRRTQDVFEEYTRNIMEALRETSEQTTASTEEVANGWAEFIRRVRKETRDLDIPGDEGVDAFIL